VKTHTLQTALRDIPTFGARLCIIFLLCCTNASTVAGTAVYPLEPMDLSSPRATLKSFFSTGDVLLRLVRQEHWDAPSRSAVKRIRQAESQLERTLDLSQVPPAARFDVSRDAMIYLYEVLSRIDLPPEQKIPNAAAFSESEKKGQPDAKLPSWTVPHTEITLTRVADGPQAGQFLFSPATVKRAAEFYEKTRALPYRRDMPLKNYAEMRHYLSLNGWMISSSTIEGFPGWLKQRVFSQAVWKWIALALLSVLYLGAVYGVHRVSRRGLSGHAFRARLRRLATPVTLLLLTPALAALADQQLTLIGRVSETVTLFAEAVTYFSLAWIAWTGTMAIAEAVISSPRIGDQSLDAHLLRLAARTIGIAAVLGIVFYVSSQLGAPLYSLVAGIGVGGIAIAFAAQNSIENFIGSLNLFADRPVRVGDFCRYGEDPNPQWQRIGTVESIGLRSTRIRGIDHTVTTIPNAEFSKMHIVNFTRRKCMLLLTVLGLRYETTDDQLRYVLAGLRDMLLAHPRIPNEEPEVRFKGFGESGLLVQIRVDVDTSDRAEFRAIREDVFLRAMKIIKDAGTGFAFPSRTVYHSRDNGLDQVLSREAEAQVRAWASAHQLPFPRFSGEYRKKVRNTLDYPPEGSPDAGD
jgi:MscS family membrane protein